jgi:hypothetical protein
MAGEVKLWKLGSVPCFLFKVVFNIIIIFVSPIGIARFQDMEWMPFSTNNDTQEATQTNKSIGALPAVL